MDKLFLGLFLCVFFFSCKENVKESVTSEPAVIEDTIISNDSVPSVLEVEQQAIDFKLEDINGKSKTLEDAAKKKVAEYSDESVVDAATVQKIKDALKKAGKSEKGCLEYYEVKDFSELKVKQASVLLKSLGVN